MGNKKGVRKGGKEEKKTPKMIVTAEGIEPSCL